jgi:superfamily II DNA/RNA helicase
MSFEDLGLSPEVLKAVTDAGYTAPTPIQEQAIPYVLMGRDVLGCAQTGTGKTASFTLPMIDILAAGRARARMPRSLILEPTRELAAQVAEAFDIYGKHHKLDHALLIGGESFVDQERKLDRGVDVLIATPGRLIDLYERGKILLSDVKILVIDEADRMLDMGFIPDVERIVGLLSKIRQTLFFSATMPPEIRRLADAFLMNPKEITVAPPASTATTVTQGLAIVSEMGKREALRRLIRSEDVKNAIIFCNRKRDVDVLYRSLTKHGFDAAALHGDMPQSKRTETLERFKNSEIRLLVASDVAARGLDVQGMSHVFNFDVPIHAEDYVHRIGRTGRAGREGRAFTLATPEDGRFVEAIQQLIGKPIPGIEIPGVEAETFLEGEEASRGRGRGGRSRSRRGGKPESRSSNREDRPQAAKPARERPAREHGEHHEPKEHREPKREPARAAKERPAKERPAAKERASYAPITMNPNGMDQALPSNVTKLPRRDRQHDDHDDDRRVVGFGDHMPAFLGRSAARRTV